MKQKLSSCPKWSEKKEKPLFNYVGLKMKRSIRKRRTSFLLFHFWDLKLVSINSALNSAPGNLTHFFKIVGVVPRKAAKLKNQVKFFLKCPL